MIGSRRRVIRSTLISACSIEVEYEPVYSVNGPSTKRRRSTISPSMISSASGRHVETAALGRDHLDRLAAQRAHHGVFVLVVLERRGGDEAHDRIVGDRDRHAQRHVALLGLAQVDGEVVLGRELDAEPVVVLDLDPVHADVLVARVLRVARDGAGLGQVEAAVHGIDPEQRQLAEQADVPVEITSLTGAVATASAGTG